MMSGNFDFLTDELAKERYKDKSGY